MNSIKVKDLGLESVMVDINYQLPVIKNIDLLNKQPIYLVATKAFEEAEDDEEIYLGFSRISNKQIRSYGEMQPVTVDGLMEKKKNLTIIE